MRVTVTIDLDELPAMLAHTLSTVLESHGCRIHDRAGVRLDKATHARLVAECSRNLAQTVAFADDLPETAAAEVAS